jgi:N-acetylmuramoyl-L-alanine amidase
VPHNGTVLRAVLVLPTLLVSFAVPVATDAAVAPSAPTVRSVSPARASTLGGTKVVVHGDGLLGAKAVWFGHHKAKLLRVVSAHKVVVRTRLQQPGAHPVRVVTAAGKSPRRSAPTIRLVRPAVVVDPGHNGHNAEHLHYINHLVPAGYGRKKACNTTGTATNSGYPEHAYTWHVAQNIRRVLKRNYVRVILTRHNDHGVGPCVNKRAKIESTKGVAAAVAIHADGGPSNGHGYQIIEDSRRPVGATHATVRRSAELAKILHHELNIESGLTPSTYYGKNGYVYSDIYAGLNLSTNPTSFLELGNMRNAGDAALQHSSAGRKRIARAVADGILTYLRRTA